MTDLATLERRLGELQSALASQGSAMPDAWLKQAGEEVRAACRQVVALRAHKGGGHSVVIAVALGVEPSVVAKWIADAAP